MTIRALYLDNTIFFLTNIHKFSTFSSFCMYVLFTFYLRFLIDFLSFILPVEDCSSGSRKLVVFNHFSQRSFLNFNYVSSWLRPFNVFTNSNLVFRRTTVLRFQSVFLLHVILADAQLTKIPTPTQCKEFCHMLHNMQIRKTERSHMWLIRFHWLFLLQSRLSDSIEQYNEPPRYRFHRTSQNRFFVVKSNRCPLRRFSAYQLSETPLKK